MEKLGMMIYKKRDTFEIYSQKNDWITSFRFD